MSKIYQTGFTKAKHNTGQRHLDREILQEYFIKDKSNLHCSSTIFDEVTAEANLVEASNYINKWHG